MRMRLFRLPGFRQEIDDGADGEQLTSLWTKYHDVVDRKDYPGLQRLFDSPENDPAVNSPMRSSMAKMFGAAAALPAMSAWKRH